MENLRELLVEQLKDLYSAETQLVEALPKTAKAANTAELKNAFEHHLDETKNHLKRLDQIGKFLKESLDGKTCQAMKGLIKEATEIVEVDYDSPSLLDANIVSIAQKIEHYEIAGYGNASAIAAFLGLSQVSVLLEETLQEEKNADHTLTDVTQEHILAACDEECDDDDSDEDEESLSA